MPGSRDVNLWGSEAISALIGALDGGLSISRVLLSDSTNDTASKGYYQHLLQLMALMPNYRFDYSMWDPAAQGYMPSQILQAGAAGERYALFPGPSSGRSRRLTSAEITAPTADYEISLRLKGDDWTLAAQATLIAHQGGAGFRGWTWQVATNGDHKFTWFPNSGSETNIVVTATNAQMGLVDGVDVDLKFTLDIDNGASGYTATFYKSSDLGANWTQTVQSATSSGVTTVGDPGSTVFYEIGGRSGNVEAFKGKIYKAKIRNGIGGPVLERHDAQPSRGAQCRSGRDFFGP
jgi:hypothetical protein